MKVTIPERPRGSVRPTMLRREPGRSWYRITNQAGESPAAEVWIYDEIGMWGVSAGQFVDEITALQVPELTVHVNSPGGEVWDGLAIYNALRSHPARVTVRVDGAALSAASFIAQAGDKVITAAQSQWMIHEASGLCVGNADDMSAMAAVLDQLSGMIAEIYQDRARGGVNKWRGLMRAESWFTADQAVDAGLADEVAVLPARQVEEAAAAMDAWDLSMYHRPAAMSPPAAAACPTHHTATVDTTWDGGAAQRRLDSPMTVATAKATYGWYDSAQVDAGKLPKSACKLPHHEVSADGTPGAANLAGVRNALSRLPQSDVPAGDRAAVEAHLRAHLDDAPEDRLAGAVSMVAVVPAPPDPDMLPPDARLVGEPGPELVDLPTGSVGGPPPAALWDPSAFRAAVTAGASSTFDADRFRDALAAAGRDVPAPVPARPRAFPLDSGAVDDGPQQVPPLAAPDLGQQLVALFRGALATAGQDVPAPAEPPPAAPPAEPAVPTDPEPDPGPVESPLAGLIRAGITLAANNTPALDDPPQAATAAAGGPQIDHHRPAVFARAIKEAQL